MKTSSSDRQTLCWRTWFCILVVLLIAGCGSQSGSKRIAVYGTVKRGGENIAKGNISFLPAEGQKGPAANTAIIAGEYSFSTENGPTAGPHRVLVHVVPTKLDLPKAKLSRPAAATPDRESGKTKTTGPNQREFDVTVSDENRKQDFKLE